MILKRLPTGMLSSNCYILGDNREGVVIDAGADTGEIMAAVASTGLKIKYIILTHAHIDHIVSMDSLRVKTGAKVLVHEKDAAALEDNMVNGAAAFGVGITLGNSDVNVKDGDTVEVGGLKLEIIHTPGHSPGSMCIKVGDSLFTGDTLFRTSIGRTDLPGGNYGEIMNSLKNKLMRLDEDIKVYPGHGGSTTIGYEKKHNPFVQVG
jgi:hydroxyacylglutathione hydrolase